MSKKSGKKHQIPSELSEPVVVTDELDLHGFFPEQAEEVVTEFLLNAHKLKLEQVRIIHGKGKSRMKFEVYKILQNSSYVDSFNDCAPEAGGWGAARVVLKKSLL